MASIKVAVRVRPFLQREIDMDSKLIIQMQDNTTGILNCKANERDEDVKYREFTFDYSYWSHDKSKNYASQEQVYRDLGTEVVDCAFKGFNACVFAYGQTGSGKTFTMMGSPDNPGLIPRICKALFDRMIEDAQKGTTHQVTVTYLEIYQEKVTDLLCNSRNNALRIREQPNVGAYVEGLTVASVMNYSHIQECMNRGNLRRTTAKTKMNDTSSRSHAIFTINFVQASLCDGVPSETVSKIHLVDLAGSERADATGATGKQLKEGAYINKSLVTLGLVISQLSKLSSNRNGRKNLSHIPYRDSVLTWLLKDSLGGNSKTFMIAAISPAECNYGETISTLRYADHAKSIINKPKINEDPNVRTIRELRAEISALRAIYAQAYRPHMLERIQEKETLEKELTKEWTTKWKEAHAILQEQKALALRKSGHGVVLDSDGPHLVVIDDDPLSTGVTLYQLKEGETTIGTDEVDVIQDIILRGGGMEPQHCSIIYENGIATIHPKQNAQVWLNNALIDAPTKLTQGCIIFLARTHVFRYNDPAEAAELRKHERTLNLSRMSLLSWSTPDLGLSSDNFQVSNEDSEKNNIENQRISLAKEKENLEKEQEAFEERLKILQEAQARLDSERLMMEKEHEAQARQLENDWQNLSAQQQIKQHELELKEKDIIQREKLEEEKKKFLDHTFEEREKVEVLRSDINNLLTKSCKYIASHLNEITFPDLESKIKFELLCSKSLKSLTEDDSNYLIDLLKHIQTNAKMEGIVQFQHDEFLKLQNEIAKQLEALSMINLNVNKSITTNPKIVDLKHSLVNRTQEEIEEIEQKKQSLRLNLKKVNSTQSPDSCEVNCSSTSLERNTLSSDTYHTATSGCSTNLPSVGAVENLMSDSGVSLRPSPRQRQNSDFSSDDDVKEVSDSQSTTSSTENHHYINRRRRKNYEVLRCLQNKINQQKQLIMHGLDMNWSRSRLDDQISILSKLQDEREALKFGLPCTLSPATEHPLQDLNSPSPSPSPIKPIHRGSTSTLDSTNFMLRNRLWNLSTQNLHRSMPAIAIASDNDALISVTGYFLRGAGKRTHYEYEVRITTSFGEWWSVLRRYSRFRDLHLAMKAKYGEKVSKIPFPPRHLFANSESLAQSRQRQLETYLRRLIEVCKMHPSCPLAYSGPISKTELINFSPFFSKGVFENSKFGTS